MPRGIRFTISATMLLATASLTMGAGCPFSTQPPDPFRFTFSGQVTSVQESGGGEKAQGVSVGDTVTLTVDIVFNQTPDNPLLQPFVLQIAAINAVTPDSTLEIFKADFVSSSLESFLVGLGYEPQVSFLSYATNGVTPSGNQGRIDTASQVVSHVIYNDSVGLRDWQVGTPVKIEFSLPLSYPPAGDSVWVTCGNATVTSIQPL
ncbi:MAG: hypothetical protein AMXMBFR84_10880 [Candidatus Hydrogenedentota bacterium]